MPAQHSYRQTCTHHSVLSDDEASHVVRGHSADGIEHVVPLVDLVVDVEVARLLPRVLRRAHVWHKAVATAKAQPAETATWPNKTNGDISINSNTNKKRNCHINTNRNINKSNNDTNAHAWKAAATVTVTPTETKTKQKNKRNGNTTINSNINKFG